MTDVTKAIMAGGFAQNTGYLDVYTYDPTFKAFTGKQSVHVALGTGVPVNSTWVVAPATVPAQVAIYDETSKTWSMTADYRGSVVYSTSTGAASVVDYVGEVKDGYTRLSPTTAYDEWDGTEWVTNTTKQEQSLVEEAEETQQTLITEINEFILENQLAAKLSLGIISDQDKAMYIAWLNYLDEVRSVDTTSPSTIVWPTAPSKDSTTYSTSS